MSHSVQVKITFIWRFTASMQNSDVYPCCHCTAKCNYQSQVSKTVIFNIMAYLCASIGHMFNLDSNNWVEQVINNLLAFSSPHQEKIAAFCFPSTQLTRLSEFGLDKMAWLISSMIQASRDGVWCFVSFVIHRKDFSFTYTHSGAIENTHLYVCPNTYTHAAPKHKHTNLSSDISGFLITVIVRAEVLKTRSTGERYSQRTALLAPCQEENRVSGHLPLLFGCLHLGCLLLHLAPGCVLKVLSEACMSRLHEETKERGNKVTD